MEANIRAYGINGEAMLTFNGHKIQLGGCGDGYCYNHQSFDCMENLSDEEKKAIEEANYS